MSSPRPLSAGYGCAREVCVVDRAWTTLQDHLLDLRKAVQDEIRNYPTPIAGCDQQFNYLLETRDRVAVEASRINEALARGDIPRATEIVQSSEHIRQDIKASLVDAPDREPG
jgi:hypothetical protein